MRFFAVFAVLAALCGCASKPPGTERVFFESASPRWLDDIGNPALKPVRGRGYLVYPQAAGPGPYPAVILLHSSLGPGSLEWGFAKRVLAQGQAVLMVDSLTSRGLVKITDDQTAVTEVSILNDLYAAHRFIAADPRIDRGRIAVAGFSKGGLPALYSAFSNIHQRFGYKNDPFSSHLAFYPWCGLELADLRLSKRPVQIHSGGADEITPAGLCAGLVKAVRRANPRTPVDFYIYEGQGHGFTHPALDRLSMPVGYPYPKDCRITQGPDGRFIERSSGQLITGRSLSPIIKACSAKGAWVSGDADAGALAYDRALAFLGGGGAPRSPDAPSGPKKTDDRGGFIR